MSTYFAPSPPRPRRKFPTVGQFVGLPLLYVGLGVLLASLAGRFIPYQFQTVACLPALALTVALGYSLYRSTQISWWHWFFIAFGAHLFLGSATTATENLSTPFPVEYREIPLALITWFGLIGIVVGGITAIVRSANQPAATPNAAPMLAPIVGYTANGQPVYGVPVRAPQSTNVCAVLALVFGILGGVPAIIFGHIALSQIKRTGESGRGLAIAGLVLGYLCAAALLVLALSFVAATA